MLDLVVAIEVMEDNVRNHFEMAKETQAPKTHPNNKVDYHVTSTQKIVEVIEKNIEDHEDIEMDKAKVVLVKVKVVDDHDF